MEEKKYVYYVTTGVVGVDERTEVGSFNELADAIKSFSHHLILLNNEAKIESQQVYYRNDKEFTQFDIQIDKELLDEDGYFLDGDVIIYQKTSKFRYGEEID